MSAFTSQSPMLVYLTLNFNPKETYMRVLAISTDGYRDWTASQEEVIDLPEFTPMACCLWITEGDEEEAANELSYFQGEEMSMSVNPHSIIMNGEEGGWTFIKLD